jgi:MFS transporter, DHA1 family, inner membrane transport protein
LETADGVFGAHSPGQRGGLGGEAPGGARRFSVGLSARWSASPRLALVALAVSAFAIGTTEFVITGVLPEVAASFQVTIPTAGLLVSGYALGVVIGAPTITAAVLYFPRKQVLLGLLMLFVAGNVVTAAASGYAVMMAGRVLAALCHGAFLGIGSAVAANLAGPDRRARAIAVMFTGLTVANVAGVPIGTFLGQHFGWRSTFWAIASLGVVSMAAIVLLVPPAGVPPGTGVRAELAAFRDSQLWLALGITALGFGAVYAPFTYLAPMMTSVAHFAPSAIAWLLIVFGLGLVVGNPLGACAADRHLMTTIAALLSMLIGVLLLFDQTAHAKIPAVLTLFALGTVGFATVRRSRAGCSPPPAAAPQTFSPPRPRSPPSTSATRPARFSAAGPLPRAAASLRRTSSEPRWRAAPWSSQCCPLPSSDAGRGHELTRNEMTVGNG